jgi:hypothetical protein
MHEKVGRKSSKGEFTLRDLYMKKYARKCRQEIVKGGVHSKGLVGKSVHEKVGRKSSKEEFTLRALYRKKCARKMGRKSTKGEFKLGCIK